MITDFFEPYNLLSFLVKRTKQAHAHKSGDFARTLLFNGIGAFRRLFPQRDARKRGHVRDDSAAVGEKALSVQSGSARYAVDSAPRLIGEEEMLAGYLTHMDNRPRREQANCDIPVYQHLQFLIIQAGSLQRRAMMEHVLMIDVILIQHHLEGDVFLVLNPPRNLPPYLTFLLKPHLIGVGIGHHRVGILVQSFNQEPQVIRVVDIVVIQISDKFAFRGAYTQIQGGGFSFTKRADVMQPGVAKTLHHMRYIAAAVIDDIKSPVLIFLLEDTLNRPRQRIRSVVGGNQHTYPGR